MPRAGIEAVRGQGGHFGYPRFMCWKYIFM